MDILVIDYPNSLNWFPPDRLLMITDKYKIILLDNEGATDPNEAKKYNIDVIDVSNPEDPPYNIIKIKKALIDIKNKYPNDNISFYSPFWFRINAVLELGIKSYHCLKLNEYYNKAIGRLK
jgi:hypothetical protein